MKTIQCTVEYKCNAGGNVDLQKACIHYYKDLAFGKESPDECAYCEREFFCTCDAMIRKVIAYQAINNRVSITHNI
jgi:hypothetical protein